MDLIYPSDLKAEQFLLGICMQSSEAINYCLGFIEKDDFDDPRNQYLFHHICEFWREKDGFDAFAFYHLLETKKEMEICGGAQYISGLIISSHGVDFEYYAKRIKQMRNYRRLMHLCRLTLEESSRQKEDPEELIDNMHKSLFEIQTGKTLKTLAIKDILSNFQDDKPFRQHLAWILDEVKNNRKPYTGVSSGYKLFDEVLGSFRNGAIYYIGGRTSSGKSTFMLNLILNMAEANMPIGVFSLEMPPSQLISKLVCFKAGVFFTKYEEGKLTPHEVSKIIAAEEHLTKMEIFFDHGREVNINQIRARARRMVMNFGVKVIFVDYLTRIRGNPKFNTKHLQVDEISKGLQSMAHELNIPVICLAQLNRESAKKNSKDEVPEPGLTDFRESGSIEEDADACIFVHRPDYYTKTLQPGIIKIIIAKNRLRGQLAKIEFARDPTTQRWYELRPLGEEVEVLTRNATKEEEYEDYKTMLDNKKY